MKTARLEGKNPKKQVKTADFLLKQGKRLLWETLQPKENPRQSHMKQSNKKH